MCGRGGRSLARRPEARQLGDAARDASPWIERLGRFGVATKGLVYMLIGVLAALAAVGTGGMTTDQRGAFSWLLRQPFGRPLLGALVVGLLGYALWRVVQAVLDAEGRDPTRRGARRVAHTW